MEFAVGNLLKRDAKEPGHETVDGEGVSGGEHLAFPGAGEGVVAELDDFVGAAAEDDVVAGEAVELGDGLAEGEAAAVGVKMGVGEAIPDRLEGGGRGAQRILIRGEFGDLGGIEAVLAGHIRDGAARLVGDEFLDVGVGTGGHVRLRLALSLSGMEKLGVKRDRRSLAGAEAVQGAPDFGITSGETGGGKKSGVDLTGFASGKEGAGGGGAQFAQEGKGAGGGGRLRHEQGRDSGRSSHFPGKVGR